jgi:hypothetical protein
MDLVSAQVGDTSGTITYAAGGAPRCGTLWEWLADLSHRGLRSGATYLPNYRVAGGVKRLGRGIYVSD